MKYKVRINVRNVGRLGFISVPPLSEGGFQIKEGDQVVYAMYQSQTEFRSNALPRIGERLPLLNRWGSMEQHRVVDVSHEQNKDNPHIIEHYIEIDSWGRLEGVREKDWENWKYETRKSLESFHPAFSGFEFLYATLNPRLISS